MNANVKGKTKATGAKGKTKATGLKEFLSNLATDPRKLGEFLHEPEAAMSAANLSEEDKTALKSGFSGIVAARLAGASLEEAFKWMKVGPPPPWVAATPQAWWVAWTPQPQFVVYPPPQYVVYPPQFVVHPPPQYVVYPPQFVVQPPPQQLLVQPPPYYPQQGTA